MAKIPRDESKITTAGLIKSLTETQNLFVSVLAIITSVVGGIAAWDTNKWIAVALTGVIVSAGFAWIYYRESRKKKSQLPEEITDSAFIGLNSFEGKDRDRFFGRGLETGELFDMVSREDFRFGVLSGESGSGKTSLINAGLIPKLREQGYCAVYLRLLNDPDQVICKAVAKASKIEWSPDQDLHEYLAGVTRETHSTLILCCDQFEEFFIHFPTEASRGPFMTLVSECVRDTDLPLKFLFALREDFLSRILEFKAYIEEPLSTRKVYSLKNFDSGQAAEIIERSVRRVNLPFQAGLSARVADDLSVKGRILPTELQIVCLQMQRKHLYSREEYERIGAKEALVQGYLQEIVRLAGNEQDVQQVLRSLISEENTKLALSLEEISERTQKKRDLVRDILKSFVLARLVREIQDQEPWRYEFTHEYLIDKINEISGSVLDEVKKANYLFREYLRRYAFDRKTRIPLGEVFKIRWYSDLKRNVRENALLGKSLRAGLFGYTLAALAILVPSWAGVDYAIGLRYRIDHNMGTLILEDAGKRDLKLKRMHHYSYNQSYPAGAVDLDRNETDLPGPADYMLSDDSETPPLEYPLHIEGLNDRVRVRLVSRPKNNPSDMVFIPPGEFRMGDKDKADGVDRDARPHDVGLDAFLIDKTEVSNQAYRKFIEAGGYASKDLKGRAVWSDRGWAWISGSERKEPKYWNDERFDQHDHPVVGVSWYEAEAYCRFTDKRLPSEAEWEKAARGPEGYNWSFGNDPAEMDSKANGPGSQDGYKNTAPVIEERYGANGYGLYHMSGNVREWVEDWYDKDFYVQEEAKLTPVNEKVSRYKILRGGSWGSDPELLRASGRSWIYPASWNSDIGFRCARTL